MADASGGAGGSHRFRTPLPGPPSTSHTLSKALGDSYQLSIIFQIFLKSSKLSQTVSELPRAFKTLPDSSRSSQSLLNSPRLFQIFLEPSKLSQTLPDLPRNFQTLPHPSRFSYSLPNSARLFQIFPELSKILQTFPEPSKLSQSHPDPPGLV